MIATAVTKKRESITYQVFVADCKSDTRRIAFQSPSKSAAEDWAKTFNSCAPTTLQATVQKRRVVKLKRRSKAKTVDVFLVVTGNGQVTHADHVTLQRAEADRFCESYNRSMTGSKFSARIQVLKADLRAKGGV